jgi:hypothetical protein
MRFRDAVVFVVECVLIAVVLIYALHWIEPLIDWR